MNEPQLLEEQRRRFGSRIYRQQTAEEVPEVLAYEPTPIAKGETPAIVEKFGIMAGWQTDPQIKTKALAVDSFIRDRIQDEQLRDSQVSYETILGRMLGERNLEDIVRKGEGFDLLDQMFQQAAIEEEMSSETYLKKFEDQVKWERVRYLKQELKEALRGLET